MQSDSSFVGQKLTSVPAGTYNKVTVGVTSAVVTYCTTTSGIAGCNAGSVTQIVAGAAAPTTPSTFSLTLASNQQAGLQLLFSFANAITVNATTQAVTGVDLTAANVLTAVSLPPTLSSLGAGQLDYLEDVTGVVSRVSLGSSPPFISVQTSTLGTITAVVTSSSIQSPNCVISTVVLSCTPPVVGQIASIDATLNADGSSSLLEYDPLSPTSVDVIEGVVSTVPSSSTQFQIVTNELVLATTNSLIGSNLNLGDPVQVTLQNVQPFAIDYKGLPIVPTPFSGGTSATDILPGQTVALRVTGFTKASGTVPALVNADFVVLRFTRVAGSVFSAPAPNFNIQSLPPFFGQTGSNLVQFGTGNPNTYFDGYQNSSGMTVGDHIAVRVLYFGLTSVPSFDVAKVRKH